MEWKIPLFKIFWDGTDVSAVTDAIKRGMSWAIGPEIEALEKKLADYVGVEYCLTFNSGTSALHALLLAYGIKANDEVIVPSFTFIATANSALFVGAKPVFADIEEQTFGLDPADVERKITSRTRAIMPIHYGGGSCQITELRKIAEKHNILLIEDAAESLGAEVNGAKAGSFGESAILSFCQNKLITTGEGGAVVTKSKRIYEQLKLIRSHGRQESVNYFATTEYLDYVSLGYNFRLSNISAALGLAQVNKIDDLIEMRQRNSALLIKKLEGLHGIILPKPPKGHTHVYQMFTIRVLGGLRDKLMEHLTANGIMSKVFFYPVHKTHFYKEKLAYDCSLPVTEKISEEVLSLPMYASMSEAEIDLIAASVTKFMSKVK